MNIEVTGPKVSFTLPIFGGINITETIIIEWIVMAIIMILVLFLTHNLKRIPTKKQIIAEAIVKFINGLVIDNMGKKRLHFAPYICGLFSFILFGSLISMTGLRSVTADFNIPVAFAIVTFVLITFYKFKNNGFLGYFKSFAQPVILIAPINILSELATPLSMALRLFGNMVGGMIITMLIYAALGAASSAIGLSIPLLSIGFPALLSIYFDLFTGCIQSFVFVMLTLAYVGDAAKDE